MDKKIWLALAAVVVAGVFLSGCSNTSFSQCCAPGVAGASCEVTLPNNATKMFLVCTAGGVCSNATTGVSLDCSTGPFCKNSTGGDTPILVCAKPERSPCATNGSCTAMLCGLSERELSPIMSVQDQFAANDSSNDGSKVDSSVKKAQQINLLNTACTFKPLNTKTNMEIKNSKGKLWLNAFRFGVGSSFSDYEEAKFYFPITDTQCGVVTGTKDRYMNYLNMKNQVADCSVTGSGPLAIATCSSNGLSFYNFSNYGGNDFLTECRYYCSKFNSEECSSTSRQSTADRLPFLDSLGHYKFTDNNFWVQRKCGEDDDSYCSNSYGTCQSPWNGNGCWAKRPQLTDQTGPLSSSKTVYYRNITKDLAKEYATEFSTGYTDIFGNFQYGPPFACSSGSECASGLCNFKTQLSSNYCVNKTNGQSINCGCYRDEVDYKIKCPVSGTYTTQAPFCGASCVACKTVCDNEYQACYLVCDGDTDCIASCQAASNTCKYHCPLDTTYINSPRLVFDGNDPTTHVSTNNMASIRAKIPMLDACEITNANISVTDAGNPGNDFRVKILGTNSCENDGAKKINLKTFGICEPCTTATMAQEKIGATSNYCPMAWQSNNFPQDPNLANAGNNWYNNGHGGNAYNNLGTVGNSRAIRLCKQAEWDDCGGHDEEDRSCDSASSLCGGYSCQKYGGWPTLTPEVTYMREKLKAYLTSNILPIIDMGDIGWSPYRRPYIDKNPNSNLVKYPCENSYEIMSGFYRHSHTVSGTSCAQNYHTSYDSAPECANDSVSIISPPLIYHDGNDCTLTNAFFKEGLGQLGTMVVNVGEVPQAGSGGDAARADLLKKAQGARGQCPNCLVGVHVSGSGVSTDAENINKLNKLFGWQDLGPYSASYNFTALDSIDLVFIDFYPHSYTSENPLLCSDPVSILSKRMNFTRTLLNHYQKPSLINHFNINESAIPDSVSTNANELEVYFWNSDTSTYRTGDGNPILTSSGTRIGTYYVTNGWVSDCSGHSGNYFGDVSLVFDPSVVQHASANITGVYSDDGYKIWPDDNNNVIQNGWTCDSGSQGWFSYNSPTYRYWGNTASQVWFYRVIDNHPPTTQLNLRFRVAYQPVISDTCWAPDNMERMMSYMFNQTSEMVGAGIIGVMYDKWDTDWSGAADGRGLRLKRAGGEDTQGDKFCSFQVNSRKVLGLSTNTFFQKVYPAAACTCQKCSDLDIRAGKCNPTCLTGATCTGVANTDGYKCPDNCYTIQTCPLCSTSASTYTCVTQTDSGKTTRPVAANTLTSPIYGNIIASLPQKCCIQETLPDDSKLNYTFVKSEATRQRNALVIYPKDGNPLADCASNPAALDTQACGFSLPLTKAKITCY